MTKQFICFIAAACALSLQAKEYTLKSPDGSIVTKISVGQDISWQVEADGQQLLSPSAIAINLQCGQVIGANTKVKNVSANSVKKTISTPLYKKSEVEDCYNQLSLKLSDDFILEFRAYDDAVAYRFVGDRKKPFTVTDEVASFKFPNDFNAYIPYVNDNRGGEKYTYSFESFYDEQPLSKMFADSLAITPVLIDQGNFKVAVSDFGIHNYPGMFLKSDGAGGLVAEFATVPLEGYMGGYNTLNYIPTLRADYIAESIDGHQALPWRAIVISRSDTELANTDITQRLSAPSKISDLTWIKPGKVAWDWWNNLHITGVDFKVGRNTETYEYYIDFARDNNLEYIIVDEGWSDTNSVMKPIGEIDIPALVNYGKDKGVKVILWASWKNVHKELEEAMKHYADMGVAGFKIDFFDADDQNMVKDMERFAKAAADHKLILDYHGMKANGLHVTYPNILNFEGVKGLENYRWSSVENNPPRYAVTAPFIRTIVGPMDYTPGAMTNQNYSQHRADNDNPASEGTRTQQIAMYVVYDAPLQMLADSPTRYKANQCCTDVIAAIPTVFDDTRVLSGKVGEYIVTARKAGKIWYVGAMTNRDKRSIEIPLDFLPGGEYNLQYVADGVNTDIDASDHKHGHLQVTSSSVIDVNMAPAGGWAAIITPIE